VKLNTRTAPVSPLVRSPCAGADKGAAQAQDATGTTPAHLATEAVQHHFELLVAPHRLSFVRAHAGLRRRFSLALRAAISTNNGSGCSSDAPGGGAATALMLMEQQQQQPDWSLMGPLSTSPQVTEWVEPPPAAGGLALLGASCSEADGGAGATSLWWASGVLELAAQQAMEGDIAPSAPQRFSLADALDRRDPHGAPAEMRRKAGEVARARSTSRSSRSFAGWGEG